ncbi:MAG: amidohydrolase [Nitrospirota bacterium]|nr:amidohydrolase [Nitrospirota bacterium]
MKKLWMLILAGVLLCAAVPAGSAEFHDGHVHLTNYIQRGLTAQEMLERMGDMVGRSVLFGLPLQQKWDDSLDGDRAPSYYLHSDAELYYSSFTDAMIAEEFRKLAPKQQKRFDPMITGFNPTDRYAVDHIRRCLLMYPGVFTGIGEFSINKEFVSPKIAGGKASLRDRAFHDILTFAGESGLVVLLHTDISTIISPLGDKPAFLDDLKTALRQHKDAVIIWAHTGVGRAVKPTKDHVKLLREFLEDPSLSHVSMDISWDLVAQYVTESKESLKEWSGLINDHRDRILFGTDAVAPKNQEAYLKTYHDYEPLWKKLDKKAADLVKKGNYERIFDAGAKKVRAWEAKNLKK